MSEKDCPHPVVKSNGVTTECEVCHHKWTENPLRARLDAALEVVAEWKRNFGPEPGHSRETRIMLSACRTLRAVLEGKP